MRNDPAPGSLAQLHQLRNRLAGGARRPDPQVDRAGQFGFVFEEETAVAETAAPVVPVAGGRSSAPVGSDAIPATPTVSATPAQVDVVRNALPAKQRDGAPWTVGALVSTLRGQLESNGVLWVEGELSNCRPAHSGHLYFTLKDGEAQLGGVLFRRQAALLKWRPSDGMAVLVRGRLSVFEGRGQLQMIAESLEPRGAGALQLQFEQMKQRLREEGLFDAERKRALPAFPRRIGVVTSRQGAVIRDIVTVCRRRHGCMSILVYPAAVQGAGAAAEIAAGIRYLNRAAESGGAQAVDLIVVARGGGSVEDLWAFNDEALARTIASSDLPVVSAVGHETDFTIADFVADLRAPTPSAAAEMITESQHRVEERVQALHARLYRGMRFQQVMAHQRFARLAAEGVLRRMRDGIDRRQQRVDSLRERLERVASELRRRGVERVRGLDVRLQQQDVRQQMRHARVLLLRRNERLMEAGAVAALRHGQLLERVERRLLQWGAVATVRQRHRLERDAARLEALSPLAVLQRGYALAFAADGSIVRSSAQLAKGEAITTQFAAGSAVLRVVEVRSAPNAAEVASAAAALSSEEMG